MRKKKDWTNEIDFGFKKGHKREFFFPPRNENPQPRWNFFGFFFFKKEKKKQKKIIKGEENFWNLAKKKKKDTGENENDRRVSPPFFWDEFFSWIYKKWKHGEVSRGILFIIFDVVCIFLGNVATREKGRFHSIYYFF